MSIIKYSNVRYLFTFLLLGSIAVEAQRQYDIQPYTRQTVQRELGDSEQESYGFTKYKWLMPQPSIGGKVSLGGMPMADSAPQVQRPFDYLNESTYIDTFAVDLQHSVTDIHIPVGSEHLALEVRRTLIQEIWGEFGLHPDARLDKPFGKCWQSNLAPCIYWMKGEGGHGTLNVSDHTGRQYTYKKYSEMTTDPGPYLVFSSGQSGHDFSKVELEHDGTTGEATLRLANGTLLTYAAARLFATTERVRWTPDDLDELSGGWGSKTIKNYHWISRLTRVEDRYGYSLEYTYSGENVIPDTITAQPAGLSLTITQSNNVITAITDPRGNEITYEYDGSYEMMDDSDNDATIREDPDGGDGGSFAPLLRTVTRENGAATGYRYWHSVEFDDRYDEGTYPDGLFYEPDLGSRNSVHNENQQHLCIRAIIDAKANTFRFDYQNATDYYTYVAGSATMIGKPRWLTQVTHPNQKMVSLSRASFGSYFVQYDGMFLPSSRDTKITDLGGTVWTYSYKEGDAGYFKWSTPWQRESLFAARQLVVSNNKGYREMVELTSMGDLQSPYTVAAHFFVPVIGTGGQVDQWTNETKFVYEGWDVVTPLGAKSEIIKPIQLIDALNHERLFEYSTDHEVLSNKILFKTDPLQRVMEYDYYDTMGKEGLLSSLTVTQNDSLKQSSSFEYADTTWPAFMTKRIENDVPGDPSFVDREISYTPHDFGLVESKVIDPEGLAITTSYGYDSNNNQVVVIDPNLNATWFEYDALNRLVAVTNSDLTVRSYGYDLRGNKTSEIDENEHTVFWEYDRMNRVINTVVDLNENGRIDGEDLSTKMTYNAMGSVASVTDPNGMVTTNVYDHLQRLTTSIIDPGGLNYSTSYEYGTNSGSLLFEPYGYKPTRIVDARGYETLITYDKLYRAVKREAQINDTEYTKTTMGYDAVGNMRFTTNWVNSVEYQVTTTTYDALNQPATTTYDDGTSVVFEYTSSGLLYGQEDEYSRRTTTDYDQAQRLVKVTHPTVSAGIPFTETGYDKAGNVIRIRDPENNVTTFLYDNRNRKTHTIQPLIWDEETLDSLNPTTTTFYDDVGNVTGILDARQNSTTNTYDAANRLISSVLPEVAVYGGGTTQPSIKTTYDKNGNPRFVTDANDVVVEMQYDALNQLVKSIDGEQHEVGYAYDAVGNRTWIKDQNGNVTTFEYDGLSRNSKVFYADWSEESRGYDWLGNRIRRTDAKNQVTNYDFDERNRLDFVDYNNGHTRNYVYDQTGNLRSVSESGSLQSALGTPNVSYTYDALNRVITETSVGVTHAYGYDKVGNRIEADYGITRRHIDWNYDALNRLQTIIDTKDYTATILHSGSDLQATIAAAVSGSLILVPNGTYGPITVNKPITIQSQNGFVDAIIEGEAGERSVLLSNNARLIGFTLTGGHITNQSGAGGSIGKGCFIADCLIRSNTASGINAYGGGLFLQTGATAQNCEIRNNSALNGGGIFCEKGGIVRNCTLENNKAESMGGGGVFMQEGGWIADSIINGNIATNTYARGGGGVLFYNDGGKVNSSTLANNTSIKNGAAHSHISTYVHPSKVGEISTSKFWNNAPTSTSNGWNSNRRSFIGKFIARSRPLRPLLSVQRFPHHQIFLRPAFQPLEKGIAQWRNRNPHLRCPRPPYCAG
ncbi:MAG: hypothetical protein V5783_09280 [Pontiella sp.]